MNEDAEMIEAIELVTRSGDFIHVVRLEPNPEVN